MTFQWLREQAIQSKMRSLKFSKYINESYFVKQTKKEKISYKMEQGEKPLSYHEVVSTNNCIYVQLYKVVTVQN